MPPAQAPASFEAIRQHALDRLRVVDSLPEGTYDVVRIAAAVCATPIALVSMLDRDRQSFKARVGLEASRTPRDVAACDHAIRAPETRSEMNDPAQDARASGDRSVIGDLCARLLAGTSPVGAADAGRADEALDRVFLRADAALSAAKDAARALRAAH